MEHIQLQERIVRMCDGFVGRVREQQILLQRWPEEGSGIKKILGIVNDLGRVTDQAKSEFAVLVRRQNVSDQTHVILAQAFQDAIGSFGTENASIKPMASVDAFTFVGSIFSVAEVLQLLAGSCRSGKVTIEAPAETFVISLSDGEVVNAYSTNNPDGMRLGEILVREFGVDDAVLRDFLAKHKDDRERLGRALAREEIVSRGKVYRALRLQMEELFRRCVGHVGLDVVYDPATPTSDEDGPQLNLADLLVATPVG